MSVLNALDFMAFDERLKTLAEEAKTAREVEARQYRNFLVGAAALIRPYSFRDYSTISAGNFYPIRGRVRQCAEHRALDRMKLTGCDLVVGFVVYGPNRTDDISHISTKTLPPCGFCRRSVYESIRDGGPISKDSLYCSIGLDGATERLTYEEILDLHGVPTISELREKRMIDGAPDGPLESELWNPDIFLKARRKLGSDRLRRAERDWLKTRFGDLD